MRTFLEKIYLFIMGLTFLVDISSPYIIRSGFSFIEEEILEGILILVSLAIGVFVFYLYRKEIKKRQEELDNNLLYIGKVNVQIQEMADAFSKMESYPTNKNKFKEIRIYILEKILGIVNVDWVMFRIIDLDSQQTLKEDVETRASAVLLKYEISNKDLLEGKNLKDYEVIRSENNNLSIDTFCVMPKIKLDENQIFMIKFLTKQLEQIFLLFTFIHSKKEESKNYFRE